MITQELVVEKILAHLNGELSDVELVGWAEDALLTFVERETEVDGEEAIMEALMYLEMLKKV